VSLSGSKCRYSNNCLHFLKHAVPLINDLKFEGSNLASASIGWKSQREENDKHSFRMFSKYLSSESTIVKQLTNEPKFESSNPTSTSTNVMLGTVLQHMKIL
jgi:hypothetical protein